jgi:hypothetical protein
LAEGAGGRKPVKPPQEDRKSSGGWSTTEYFIQSIATARPAKPPKKGTPQPAPRTCEYRDEAETEADALGFRRKQVAPG